MTKQEEIMNKQNELDMLKCQFASRKLFNRAEIENYCSTLLSIASILCVFFPNQLIIPLILDVFILYFSIKAKNHVNIAAQIRNYFDHVILGLNSSRYSDHEIREIYGKVEDLITKNQKECNIQTQNTGRDNPPGVKNWYEFSRQFEGNEVILECQRQNCWWNNRLYEIRLATIFVFSIVIASIIYIAVNILGISTFQTLICITGSVLKTSEQFIENIRYYRLSTEINNKLSMPQLSQNIIQLEHLQELICRRRTINVLEINQVHKMLCRHWSEQYERISKHCGSL